MNEYDSIFDSRAEQQQYWLEANTKAVNIENLLYSGAVVDEHENEVDELYDYDDDISEYG